MPQSRVAELAKGAAIVLGLWTLYALNETLHTYFQFKIWQRPMSLASAAYAEFAFAYLCAAATPAVLWVGRRYRLSNRRPVRSVLAHLLAGATFAVVVRLAWDLVGGAPKPFYLGGATWWKALTAVSSTYEVTFTAYVMILLAGYAFEYQARYRKEAADAETLRAGMLQAQLQSLRMQLQPHFLFNTLHSISALVRECPPAAERTISLLSDLLRHTLDHGSATFMPLREELHAVELFLEIERTRYEERLEVRWALDDSTLDAQVPGFILQPLVENAIRHGVARRSAPGYIAIASAHRADKLVLTVTNSGPLLREPLREGIGIGSTKSRLQTLYADSARFEIINLTQDEVQASITLPFATKDREGQYGYSYADSRR
ncbi:MAG: histidine kinase [Acidobacteria bacterium]|nr:histidine kinase [Acidobacteriota bacterium]